MVSIWLPMSLKTCFIHESVTDFFFFFSFSCICEHKKNIFKEHDFDATEKIASGLQTYVQTEIYSL